MQIGTAYSAKPIFHQNMIRMNNLWFWPIVTVFQKKKVAPDTSLFQYYLWNVIIEHQCFHASILLSVFDAVLGPVDQFKLKVPVKSYEVSIIA